MSALLGAPSRHVVALCGDGSFNVGWSPGQGIAACAIGGSIGLSFVTACLFGLSIPSLLHSLKLDPKIAAGPVTLAVTDFVALALYFGIASLVLWPRRVSEGFLDAP